MYFMLLEEGSSRYISGYRKLDDRVIECKCGIFPVIPPDDDKANNSVILAEGYVPNSFFWSFPYLCINQQLLDMFEIFDVKGFKTHKISIVDDKRVKRDKKRLPVNEMPEYFRVLLNTIPICEKESELDFSGEECDVCGRGKYAVSADDAKIVLKRESYAFEDIFKIQHYGDLIFCSAKIITIIEQNNIKGVKWFERTITLF